MRVASGGKSTVSDSASLLIAGAPVVVTPPTSVETLAGGSATFTVVATGDAPLAYQWRRDGVAIPGATSAAYTVASASADSAGDYSVVVSNAKGRTESGIASLTIVAPRRARRARHRHAARSSRPFGGADRDLHRHRDGLPRAHLPVDEGRRARRRRDGRELHDPGGRRERRGRVPRRLDELRGNGHQPRRHPHRPRSADDLHPRPRRRT